MDNSFRMSLLTIKGYYSEGFSLLICFVFSLLSVAGVDPDADLPLQLLEGHLGTLALRPRPPTVNVDSRAPEQNGGRSGEILRYSCK